MAETLEGAMSTVDKAQTEGEPVAEKSAEETERTDAGLTDEEFRAAREAYLTLWPLDRVERR